MPLEIIGDSGSTLIDDSYMNMVLAVKGGLVLAPTGSGTYSYYIQFTYVSSEPSVLMALELGATPVGHLSSIRSGNVWTFTVHFNPADVGKSITYYIFTIPPAVADAGGMMQLRNAANQLTFDSNLKYMRVEGFYQIDNTGGGAGQLVATSMLASRTYAAITVTGRYFTIHQLYPPMQVGPPYVFLDAATVGVHSRSGANIASANKTTQQTQGQSDNSAQWTRGNSIARLLVLDVTNF